MQLKKLTEEEYDVAYNGFIRYSADRLPLLGELSLNAKERSEKLNQAIDYYIKNTDSTTAFAFLYSKYGEPTFGHQNGDLFKYAFLVDGYLIIIIGNTQTINFQMYIPPEAMRSLWDKEQTLRLDVMKTLLDEGVPLLQSQFNTNLLSEIDREKNTENLLKFAPKVLDSSGVNYLTHIVKGHLRSLSEDSYDRYLLLLGKIADAVQVEIDRISSQQSTLFSYSPEELKPYYDAELKFLEFCKFLGTRKIRFGRKVLTIRGFESAFHYVTNSSTDVKD